MSPRGRPDDRGERAGRILDVAADLLLRYGYDKTTIDDIARTAGVAKGTVYLHWRSRELLFLALLRREHVAMLGEVRDGLAAGGPADLRSLIAEVVRAYQRRPLLTAVLLRDAEVLGKLARTAAAEGTPHGSIVEHLATLRAGGWIRTDQSQAEQVTVVSTVFLGYFVTAPLMPEPFRLPADAVPALLADTIHRAVRRAEPLTPAEVADVDRVTHEYVTAAAHAAEQKLREAQLPGEESA
jgi:AcrR family transcriptional regulator